MYEICDFLDDSELLFCDLKFCNWNFKFSKLNEIVRNGSFLGYID